MLFVPCEHSLPKGGGLLTSHRVLHLRRENEGYHGLACLQRNDLPRRFGTSWFRSPEKLLGPVSYLGKRTTSCSSSWLSRRIRAVGSAGSTASPPFPGYQLSATWGRRLFCPAS